MRFFLLESVLISSLSAAYPETRYDHDRFVAPADCLNDDYDLEAALLRKDMEKRGGVFYHDDLHGWISYGSEEGRSCLKVDNLDGDQTYGCAPFSNITRKFKRFQTCFRNKWGVRNIEGEWFDSRKIEDWKNIFSIRSEELLIYRLAMQAERKGDWLSDQTFKDLFSQAQLETYHAETMVRSCLDNAQLNRSNMKCWSIIMGSPNRAGPTITERAKLGIPAVKKVCKVPTMCGRLASTRLHHFATSRYEKMLLFGFIKLFRMRESWRVTSQGQVVNLKCSLNQKDIGEQLCWHYSSCLMEMMKQVCAEHSACCPSQDVHKICASNLSDSRCTVCNAPEPEQSETD